MIHIRCMTAADIESGMRLKAQAGWNQTPADWRRMLAMQPDGCFVAEWNGVLVGTTVACLFDTVAWMAMVLVDATLRGRGIGKALLRHALEFADGQGASSVRLDATPLGQSLYEQLGFLPQYSLNRYAGSLPAELPGQQAVGVRQAETNDYPTLLLLDRAVTQTDRSKFLVRLFQEHPDGTYVATKHGQIAGYYTLRPGSSAWQPGPCIAEPEVGPDLLQHAFGHLRGRPVLLDVPAENEAAAELAQTSGLAVQRSFVRMCRGREITDDTKKLWASSGPELG